MNKRIFVAIDISDDVRRAVEKYISELKRDFSNIKVGWEKAEKLHLTLKFLGDSDERQIGKLFEIVENFSKQFSTLNFQISETGVFPSPRNARVLWLGVKGDLEILRKINAELENECEKIGFKKENRNFTPHLTIARIREPHKSKNLIEKHLTNNFPAIDFVVSEMVVYESRLQPSGSVYGKIFAARMSFAQI